MVDKQELETNWKPRTRATTRLPRFRMGVEVPVDGFMASWCHLLEGAGTVAPRMALPGGGAGCTTATTDVSDTSYVCICMYICRYAVYIYIYIYIHIYIYILTYHA